MGFDISKFIEKVERFAQTLPGSENSKVGDNKLDSFEKASLFNSAELKAELQGAYEKGEISAQDAKAIFGLELSANASSGPRKAPGAGDVPEADDGVDVDGDSDTTVYRDEKGNEYYIVTKGDGTRTIVFNNVTNININVTITSDMREEIQKIIDAINNKTIEFDMDEFKDFIENNLIAFLRGVFENFRDDMDVKFTDMLKFFESMFNMLDMDIKDFQSAMTTLITASLNKIINRWGADFKELVNMLKTMTDNQNENNELLMMLYDAVGNLTNNFNDYSEYSKQMFVDLLAEVKKGNVTAEEIKVVLNAIQNDTSENNQTSKLILQAIKDGNKALLEALANIDANFSKYGDEIKALLTEIAANTSVNPNPIDLTALLDKLDGILLKLDNIDNNTSQTAQNTAEINATNKLILEIVQKGIDLNLPEGKLDEIIAAIGQVESAVGDVNNTLDEQLGLINQLLTTINTNLEKLSGKPDEEGLVQKIYDTLIDILGKIGTNPGSPDTKDYTDLLTDILNALGGKGANINQTMIDNFAAIIELLGKSASGEIPGSGILGVLGQIWAAIQDHTVNVLITIRDQDENIIYQTPDPHEGRQVKVCEFTLGEDNNNNDDTDAVKDVKEAEVPKGKKVLVNGKIYIQGEDGHTYDTLGRLVK